VPLGLYGFALTVAIAGVANCKNYPFDSMQLGMFLSAAGFMQIIAGVFAQHKNDTFGVVAFIGYGFFWVSLFFLGLLARVAPDPIPPADLYGTYFMVWFAFSLALTVIAFKEHMLCIILLLATTAIYFLLLSIASYSALRGFQIAGGVFQIITAFITFYTATGILMNLIYGKVIIPLGEGRISSSKLKQSYTTLK
jgi:succinate-acetate transporter protein